MWFKCVKACEPSRYLWSRSFNPRLLVGLQTPLADPKVAGTWKAGWRKLVIEWGNNWKPQHDERENSRICPKLCILTTEISQILECPPPPQSWNHFWVLLKLMLYIAMMLGLLYPPLKCSHEAWKYYLEVGNLTVWFTKFILKSWNLQLRALLNTSNYSKG